MCRETVQERYERGRIQIAASGPTKLDFRELRKGSCLEEEWKSLPSSISASQASNIQQFTKPGIGEAQSDSVRAVV